MKHKTLALFGVLLLGFALAACGGSDEPSATNTPRPTATVASLEPVTVDPVEVDITADPGTFSLSLTGFADVTIENNTRGRDVSDNNEHILQMVDPFTGSQGTGIRIYFPHDFEPGSYALVTFNPIYEAGRYAARVEYGGNYFFSTPEGVLTISSYENGLISGSFKLTAPAQANRNNVIEIEGAFTDLALAER